jgi:Aspartyl protease/Domain of unknown function (DUF4124)
MLDLRSLLRHHGFMRTGAAVGLGIVLLLPALALAQMYRWEDPRGTLHYTNTPEAIPESYRAQVDPLPAAPMLPAKAEPIAPAAIARSVIVTRIPYTRGDPIFVNARIGGTGPLTLILDTGADRTMVAPQALWRLGISTANAPRAEIRGVTGASQGDVVQVASVEIGEAKVGPLRIIAHDADLKKADGLLGRDFLEHFTVTIDSRELVVTLAPK